MSAASGGTPHDRARGDIDAPPGGGYRRYIVVVGERAETVAVSRREHGPHGPFSGPWRLLTETEAEELTVIINGDGSFGEARALEVFRYDRDPAWREEFA